MSEQPPSPEEKSKSIDPEVLRQQAEELRQSGYMRADEAPKPAPRWVQGVYLVILVLVIGSVIFLLVSRESRLRLLRGVAHGWSRVSSSEENAGIFKLPPPPPKAVEPKVVTPGSPRFVFRGGAGSAPELSAETTGPESAAAGERDESGPPSPPEKTAGSKGAYELLVKNSEVAQKLTSNGFPDLQFKEWKPVRNNPPDFWINVIATRAGQDVQFVWSVNTESGTVTPLSQNARDLARQ